MGGFFKGFFLLRGEIVIGYDLWMTLKPRV